MEGGGGAGGMVVRLGMSNRTTRCWIWGEGVQEVLDLVVRSGGTTLSAPR